MIQQTQKQKCVRFAKTRQVRTFGLQEHPIMVTYDSGADGHYISEHDRAKAGLPILRRSTKRVGVANGVRDEYGRYRIPLIQQRGQWQPRTSNKRTRQALEKANSVYDLPSIEQAIKWMHAVCGYPVKSTWIKAVKAGNFIGWPLLTEKNVAKYYPETVKTPKGHMAQTRKNV
eukprot:scaffold5184_cov39-Cyclotella_meneghiniana.AAC.3